MNKAELISAVAEKSGLTKVAAKAAIEAFTEVVAEELKAGNSVQITGFGSFEVNQKPERDARNPLTNEIVHVAASKSPKFKAGNTLKRTVNQ